jgi:hypothetical protein
MTPFEGYFCTNKDENFVNPRFWTPEPQFASPDHPLTGHSSQNGTCVYLWDIALPLSSVIRIPPLKCHTKDL